MPTYFCPLCEESTPNAVACPKPSCVHRIRKLHAEGIPFSPRDCDYERPFRPVTPTGGGRRIFNKPPPS